MAAIETLQGVTKLSEYMYEVTENVNLVSGIDDIEQAVIIQKDGGILRFSTGCTTVFTECDFVEEATVYVCGADNYRQTPEVNCRFNGTAAPVFKGCSWKLGAGSGRSDFDLGENSAPSFLTSDTGRVCYLQINNISSSQYNHFVAPNMIIDGLIIDQRGTGGVLEFKMLPDEVSKLTIVDNNPGSTSKQVGFLSWAWKDDTWYPLRDLRCRNIASMGNRASKVLQLIDPYGDIPRGDYGGGQGTIEVWRTYMTTAFDPATGDIAVGVNVHLVNNDTDEVVLSEKASIVNTILFQHRLDYDVVSDKVVQNNYTRGFYGYGFTPSSSSFAIVDTNSIKYDDGKVLMFEDENITEKDPLVVAAYSIVNTAEELYDLSALHLSNNYKGETEMMISKVGNVINLGELNMIIDPSAASVCACDGETVTVRSSLLDAKLITNGTITLLNGAGTTLPFLDSTQDSSLIAAENYTFRVFATKEDRAAGSGNELATYGKQFSFKYDTIKDLLVNDDVWIQVVLDNQDINYPSDSSTIGHVLTKGDNVFASGTAGAIITLSGTVTDVNNRLGFIEQIVYIDTNKTDNGNGTNLFPFNSELDAINYARANNIPNIYFKGNIVLPVSVAGLKIYGQNSMAVDMNGQNIDGAVITNASVYGACIVNWGARIEHCITRNITGFAGFIQKVYIDGDIEFANDANISESSPSASAVSPRFTVTDGVNLGVREFAGGFSLAGVVDGSKVYVDTPSGEVTIEDTCVGGLITVRGGGRIIDNSNGSEVLDNTSANIVWAYDTDGLEEGIANKLKSDLAIVNNGIKKASILVPHTESLVE